MRSYTQHTAISEVVHDYRRTCEYCDKSFDVLYRIYDSASDTSGHGIVSTILDTERHATDRVKEAVTQSALGNLSSVEYYHRCPYCGLYGFEDLEVLSESFCAYRRGYRNSRIGQWCIAVFFLFFGAVFISAGNSGTDASVNLMMKNIGVFLTSFSVLLLWLGWFTGRNLSVRFQKKLDAMNSEERVSKWLKNWKQKSPKLIEELQEASKPNVYGAKKRSFLEISSRHEIWKRMHRLQHRYDTVSWIFFEKAAGIEPNEKDEFEYLHQVPSSLLQIDKAVNNVAQTAATDKTVLRDVLMDAICCVMVADGKISSKERSAVYKIMEKTKSAWGRDEIDEKVSEFVGRVKESGFKKVFEDVCVKLPEFKKKQKEALLLQCIDYMMRVDGELHPREKQICQRFKAVLEG
jgi:uncharacterized tellurite resistance protein B-like protein